MADPIVRVTLFVPGAPRVATTWFDPPVEAEWIENDGTFAEAFSLHTVGVDVVASLGTTPGALVLHWPSDLRDGRGEFVAAVERLRKAGAIAVRVEQSRVGWDVSTWLELASSENAWSWHRAVVAFLRDDDALQSCGMHAFSLPDVRIQLDEDGPALELASQLNVYQLAEDPVILSGQTFAPDTETPRRVVERWPDTRYPPGHACHNPYGVWRLGPPGGVARPTSEPLLVFVPALHAILIALERRHGKPLSRASVEAARDGAACIAMTARDAQKLERSRGYSDLNPEFVWEQWSAVRAR